MSAADNQSSTVPAQACSTCHSRKIRCDSYYRDSVFQACTRCQKSNADCVPHVRKRRKIGPSVQEDSILEQRPPSVNQQEVVLEPSPQSSYLGRSEYVAAHFPINEEDASQYRTVDTSSPSWPSDFLHARLPSTLPQSIRQSLVTSFLRHCRPWMPLLEEDEIYSLQTTNPDCFLMTAIYVAGSKVSSSPRAAEVGAQCYQRARAMFFADQEKDIVHVIIAIIFLQWWNPSGPEHVSTNNSSFWLRMSVALAHQIGLHKEPNRAAPNRCSLRKIWWSLVSRDSQIATSHGRPRAINQLDSDVLPLTASDFDTSGLEGPLFMNFVRITEILGDITEHVLRSSLSTPSRIGIEEALLRWVDGLPPGLHLHDRQTKQLKPYSFASRHLHLTYFVAIMVLFHQKHSAEGPSLPSLVAAGFVIGILEEYLDWGDIATVSSPSIFYALTAALTLISSHRFRDLASVEAATNEVRVAKTVLAELKKRFATAIGAERVLNHILRLSANASTARQRSTQQILSSRQLEFFLPFGPGLCRHWSIVQSSRDTTRTSSVQPSHTASRGNTEFGDGNDWVSMPPAVDQPAQQDTSPQFGELFVDDVFGQLWWNDFNFYS